jgi:hypothetical protein
MKTKKKRKENMPRKSNKPAHFTHLCARTTQKMKSKRDPTFLNTMSLHIKKKTLNQTD